MSITGKASGVFIMNDEGNLIQVKTGQTNVSILMEEAEHDEQYRLDADRARAAAAIDMPRWQARDKALQDAALERAGGSFAGNFGKAELEF